MHDIHLDSKSAVVNLPLSQIGLRERHTHEAATRYARILLIGSHAAATDPLKCLLGGGEGDLQTSTRNALLRQRREKIFKAFDLGTMITVEVMISKENVETWGTLQK
jgi:hypothetical protein